MPSHGRILMIRGYPISGNRRKTPTNHEEFVLNTGNFLGEKNQQNLRFNHE